MANLDEIQKLVRLPRGCGLHALRKRAFERDNYTCVKCGDRANTIHHLTYRYGRICPVKYVISLCWTCHRHIDGYKVAGLDR